MVKYYVQSSGAYTRWLRASPLGEVRTVDTNYALCAYSGTFGAAYVRQAGEPIAPATIPASILTLLDP